MGIWSRKSLAELRETQEGGKLSLKRTLSAWHLTLLGIGCIIGAGLFSITGIAAAENAGPAVVFSFLIAAIGCALAGLCYSEIASMIPLAGSAYTYAYATMGELIAWMIGWDLILEYAIGAATVSISWSAYFTSLLQDFNIHINPTWSASPWQPVRLEDGSQAYGWINLPALLIIVAISYLLIRGIKQTAIVNSIIVFIKVSIVLIFIFIGFAYIDPENHTPFIPTNTGTFGEFGFSGIMRAAGIVFFAYIGFDAVSTTAQEAVKPQKSIPVGILGSLIICTILYTVFAYVLTGMVSYKHLNVAAPVAVAIEQTPFWWFHFLVKIAILAGLTSVMLVLLLGQSRIFFAMSRDGLLPSTFSTIHPRYQTPWISNLALMCFAGLFSAFAPLSMVGSMTSIGTLLAFSIVCAGALILRYTEPQTPRPFRAPFFPLVPIVGIGVCLSMMISLGIENWLRLIFWLILGLALYIFYGRKHTHTSQK